MKITIATHEQEGKLPEVKVIMQSNNGLLIYRNSISDVQEMRKLAADFRQAADALNEAIFILSK